MTLRLTSPAFTAEGTIPVRYTCDGEDMSPPLSWSGAPQGTRSFALICRDPDAPAGVWYHWALFDIAQDRHGLEERCRPGGGMHQAVNDFGQRGYGGPCPPHGHGRHHYHFTLYALSVEYLDVAPGAHCRDVEAAARAHALATAELTGLYGR
jgi:Raf kinase inhibitor-like YbhB/YbcL family protein